MEHITGIVKKNKFIFSMLVLSFLCWGRLLFLRGIWVDDWAWIWHYFSTGSLSEFIAPLSSLRHPLDGLLFYANFKLLDIIPAQADNIWNIWKFIFFITNPILLYLILRGLMKNRSILPATIAAIYLTSPIVHNLCTVELGRRVYIFAFLVSILLSMLSVRKSGIRITYYISAAILSVISICGIESFFFFELARPALIFYLFNKDRRDSSLKNTGKTVIYCMPFFILGSFILLFNMGVIRPRSGVYADAYTLYHVSLGKYLMIVIKAYAVSIVRLFEFNFHLFFNKSILAKDYIYISFTALLSAILMIFTLFRIDNSKISREDHSDIAMEARSWVIIGAILTILGLFPYMVVRGALSFGIGSKHAILASIGFSIFLASALLWLYHSVHIRKAFYYILFAGVIFLGVFNCNVAVKAYSDDWQQQKAFWAGFVKKVPEIKKNTYLIVDMPRNEHMFLGEWRGTFEFSAPLNLIYAASRSKDDVNSHFADTFEDAMNAGSEQSYVNIRDKAEIEFESYKGIQKLYPRNLIMASYHDGRLYLNDEIENSGLGAEACDAAAHASKDQIIYGNRAASHPLRRIMGFEDKDFQPIKQVMNK